MKRKKETEMDLKLINRNEEWNQIKKIKGL